MDTGIAPTRSNLMRIRDELAFSRLGYELLDQKRSILVSELLTLVDQAVDYQNRVEKALGEAQKSLEDSIMHTSFSGQGPFFSPEGTSMLSEVAIEKYRDALTLMGQMAELKVSIMRLSREVKKTIRKVNALEKLVIPDKEETMKYLEGRIEESERENFILLKSVKDRLERTQTQEEVQQ